MIRETTQPPGEHLLRIEQVSARLGLGRSAIYALVKTGQLGAPIKLGVRASAWPSSIIDAFIADRMRAARGRRG